MGVCAVCQGDMDMQEFGDTQQATTTCYKLECGHAYHTKCVVDFMRSTTFDCVNCNRHKLPKEQLTMQGLLKQTFESVKRTKPVAEAKRKCLDVEREYRRKYQEVHRSITAFVKQRSHESGLVALGRKLGSQKAAYIRAIKRTMLTKSPLTAGAFTQVPQWQLDWIINGRKWRRGIRRGYFVRI
jgi:hypothetical protein